MGKTYLTKSAFTRAMSCPTKLYYLSNGYPNTLEENEFLELLAEGGFIVGQLGQFLFPDGIAAPSSGDPDADYAAVREKILTGDTTLFEASLLSGSSLAVADILKRTGNSLQLIEVKSISFDPAESGGGSPFRGKKGDILAEYRPYIYDLAFQFLILQRCFPQFNCTAALLMVDKSKRPTLDRLPSFFHIQRGVDGSRPTIEFTGDARVVAENGDILSLVPASSEVDEVIGEVAQLVEKLEAALAKGERVAPVLTKACRDCEYRGDELSPNGFNECWKGLPRPEHHIFDLYFGTTVTNEGRPLFDEMLEKGQTSLFDIPTEVLKGKRGERQLIQIRSTRENREWIDPRLTAFVRSARYPLHFIDFETTRTALPYHAGMRPFDQLAFQWSCHTVESPGADPVHTEWLNTSPEFPNFAFARALMETLSANGTVLTWAQHESNVINDIISQMSQYGVDDPPLSTFLSQLVSSKGSQGRLVDMNRLTIEYYFHPRMKGKTSIKSVFPAVWSANAEIRGRVWARPYARESGGEIVNPYDLLPPLNVGGQLMSVQEGTAAMRAYEMLIFGNLARDPEGQKNVQQLLLEYCKLDTLAMLVIWEHWRAS